MLNRFAPPTGSRTRDPRVDGVRATRCFDAFLLLVFGPPALGILILLALANTVAQRSLSKAFFFQTRVGWRGRRFTLVKLRTMRDTVDACGRPLPDALRVTRFGRWLRNTHLDELPQLWNVLRGEMSFIGPRPEMECIHRWACERIEGFEARLAVRPGLTGLAQTTQGYTPRTVAAYREKLRLDRQAIQQRSVLGHIRLLFRTAKWMAQGRGWRWHGLDRTDASPTILPGPGSLRRALEQASPEGRHSP